MSVSAQCAEMESQPMLQKRYLTAFAAVGLVFSGVSGVVSALDVAGAVTAGFESTALLFGVVALVAVGAWFSGPRLPTAAGA